MCSRRATRRSIPRTCYLQPGYTCLQLGHFDRPALHLHYGADCGGFIGRDVTTADGRDEGALYMIGAIEEAK